MVSRNRARRHISTNFHLDYLVYLPVVAMLITFIWIMSIHKARMDTINIASNERLASIKYPRPAVITYIIRDSDTLESIASNFNVSVNSIIWLNDDMELKDPLSPDTIIRIPPTTGVVHIVERGDTLESIAEKYKVTTAKILSFPYNQINEDRAFPLTFGQTLIIPDGVKP